MATFRSEESILKHIQPDTKNAIVFGLLLARDVSLFKVGELKEDYIASLEAKSIKEAKRVIEEDTLLAFKEMSIDDFVQQAVGIYLFSSDNDLLANQVHDILVTSQQPDEIAFAGYLLGIRTITMHVGIMNADVWTEMMTNLLTNKYSIKTQDPMKIIQAVRFEFNDLIELEPYNVFIKDIVA